jgi:MFS family permease
MVALISLLAFETLAVTASMPIVARELNGLRLYGLAFGSTLATSVVGMVVAGQWCDRIGPARPLWAGLSCFVTGLLVAGLAGHMWILIGGRLLQGLGSGACMVALYVLVARVYPENLLPRVFAAFSAGWVVPSLIGPALSGWIAEYLGWRWVFLGMPVLAIPAALMLWPASARLPIVVADAGKQTTLAVWAVGAATGMLLLYVAGQQHGTAAAMLLPALALLAICSWKLLPAGTLRVQRGLPSVIALRGLVGSAIFSCEAFFPLLLSRERGLTTLQAGLALSLGALGWFSGSWYQGHMRGNWTRQQLLRAGCMLLALGIISTTAVLLPSLPVWGAIVAWTLANVGMGLAYSSLSVLVLALSPPAQQGNNISALQLSEAMAVATTMAISGSLFALLLDHGPSWGYAAVFFFAIGAAIAAVGVARRV